MSFRHLRAILRAAWWVPVLSMLLGGGAALLVSLLMPRQYTADTQLFIAASDTGSTNALAGSQLSQQRVASYTELLTGGELAKRLIAAQDLHEAPQDLVKQISADSSPNTVLIDVHVTDSNPARAQRLAQGIDTVFPQLVAELEKAGGQASPVSVTVVTQPDLPTTPTSPHVVQNVALGCLAGLFVGVGTVIGRDRLDRTIKTTEQTEELAAAPALGVVLRQNEIHTRHVIARGAPEGEGFREIRTNLQFVRVDSPPKTILITSALPGEGKTTLTVNLARVLSDAGRKVTVVDADLRHPKVTRYLSLVGDVGLTNVLAGTADAGEMLQAYDDGAFDVIGAGPKPPNPGELLSSAAMSDLLVKLGEENDVVLVDGAPLLSVADTLGLAPMTDGVLLAVHHGRTEREQLRQAAAALGRVGARTLGVVLNMVPPNAEMAAEYGLADGYGYRGGPQAP